MPGERAPEPKRIGLFGGSFDPIHRGHVEPLAEVARDLQLDRIFFLPTGRPPHKPGRKFVAPTRRFAMVELALLEHDRLVADDFELDPKTYSYTIDTVRHFERRLPGAEIHLIIGMDSYLELGSWRDYERLLESTVVVVLGRPGYELRDADLTEPLARHAASGRRVLAENRLWRISSTSLREEIAQGRDPGEDLLAPPVLRYCRKYELYR